MSVVAGGLWRWPSCSATRLAQEHRLVCFAQPTPLNELEKWPVTRTALELQGFRELSLDAEHFAAGVCLSPHRRVSGVAASVLTELILLEIGSRF